MIIQVTVLDHKGFILNYRDFLDEQSYDMIDYIRFQISNGEVSKIEIKKYNR